MSPAPPTHRRSCSTMGILARAEPVTQEADVGHGVAADGGIGDVFSRGCRAGTAVVFGIEGEPGPGEQVVRDGAREGVRRRGAAGNGVEAARRAGAAGWAASAKAGRLRAPRGGRRARRGTRTPGRGRRKPGTSRAREAHEGGDSSEADGPQGRGEQGRPARYGEGRDQHEAMRRTTGATGRAGGGRGRQRTGERARAAHPRGRSIPERRRAAMPERGPTKRGARPAIRPDDTGADPARAPQEAKRRAGRPGPPDRSPASRRDPTSRASRRRTDNRRGPAPRQGPSGEAGIGPQDDPHLGQRARIADDPRPPPRPAKPSMTGPAAARR